MQKTNRGESEEADEEQWVCDSSVDHNGKAPLRASTGVWKASLFIIVIEFSERLSYFSISSNLITYLTKIIHQDLKTAAKGVNYWSGVSTVMPLVGGFIADAYMGRFCTVLISSAVYLLGLCLLTMSQLVPSLKPCDMEICYKPRKAHEVVFFLALYLISVGTGGYKPSLQSFGADQFDDDHSEERKKKMSYFNLWNLVLTLGLLLGVTVIVYVQDYVGWGIASIILTAVMAIGLVIFYVGKPYYRYRAPNGSPLTPMLQVLVAAMAKRNLPYPANPAQLYEIPKSQRTQGRLLCRTSKLRFLDKAAIVEYNEDKEDRSVDQKQQNPWRLATVTQVEEMKLILNMVPIWLTSLIFGSCVAQASFFTKQSSTMNRKIGRNFEIPAASMYSLGAIAMMVSICIYEKILVPVLRRTMGNERGISILQRIGVGMGFSVLSMAVAALVERKRLRIAEREIVHGRWTGSIHMSVFWLIPQFVMLGIGDGFTLVGLQEYFYDQVPDSMRSLGIAFFLSTIGVGSFLSSLLIEIVDHITEKVGRSWFGKDLRDSRLDYFYWFLAAIYGVNLCVYVFLAKRYSYKSVQRRIAVDDCNKGEGTELMASDDQFRSRCN